MRISVWSLAGLQGNPECMEGMAEQRARGIAADLPNLGSERPFVGSTDHAEVQDEELAGGRENCTCPSPAKQHRPQ